MQYNTHGSVDAAGGPNVWDAEETAEKEAPTEAPMPAGEPPAAEPVAQEPPASEEEPEAGDGQQSNEQAEE